MIRSAPQTSNFGLTSIVMLTRDRLPYTELALSTLAETRGQTEWILVDTGSSDRTLAYLEHWRNTAPDKRIVIQSPGSGAAAARNLGWRRASGDYLAFIDNDVYLDKADPDWLLSLLALLERDPQIAAVSPLLLFPGPSDLVQCAGGGISA